MKQNTPINILIADDHKIITKSVEFIVKSIYKQAQTTRVYETASIHKALKSQHYQVLITDVSFPEGNILQILPNIRALYPQIKILIFSGNEENIYGVRCIEAGADGYVSKLSEEEQIIEAIQSIIEKGKYISPSLKEALVDSYMHHKRINPIENLSDRELEIAQLLIKGQTNSQIAEKLCLQKSTISTYKNRIFEKLQIQSIPELIIIFQENNKM